MIPTIAQALSERGYDTLTAVQQAVLEPHLEEADLLVSAQTGSGKTVGFGLAIAPTVLDGEETLGRAGQPLALIVAPTRELAFQVRRELEWLYAKTGAVLASAVGGMDPRDERRALERGAHIVVGTPGRIRDHITRGALDLSAIKAIVLDEADEMLDLGFREDLEFMLGEAPEERRTLMFSATVPPMIAKLAESYQRDAVRVQTASEKKQHADITYQALNVAPQDAENAIINVLLYHDAANAIVFANTRAMVARLTARLSNRGFQVVALSGELSQNERTHALQAMRDGRARVCVATDVAARGIDLPGLELVVHAELPSNAETLLHRSGRTGRAGRKGVSAMIVPPKVKAKAQRLLKFAKLNAEWIEAPSAEEVQAREEDRLLNDPAWSEQPSDGQVAFAARLLELHSAEAIAAAYLRLYQARRSAPEELGAPAVMREKKQKPKEEFGPSVWFSLSVGRNDRAEPRWLLPMVCRQGNLDKDSIGAIRIRDSESFVEIAEASVPTFLAALGVEGKLEDGVSVRQMDEAPEFSPRREDGPREDRPKREYKPREDREPREPREDRAPREYKPREDRGDRGDRGDKPRYDKPKFDKPRYDSDKPREYKPRREDGEGGFDRKPRHKSGDKPKAFGDKPRYDGPRGDKPAYKKSDDGAKSFGKKSFGDKPRSDKPYGDKPRGDKPYGDKPRGDKPFGKKFDDKPRKSFGDKPKAFGDKPARPKPTANDTSKRFTPPGVKVNPRAKGGDTTPRKKK